MSSQLKPTTKSGRKLLDKLFATVDALGDRADELKLEELEASGMFSTEQAVALRGFFADVNARAALHILQNPERLREAVRVGKLTEEQAWEAWRSAVVEAPKLQALGLIELVIEDKSNDA